MVRNAHSPPHCSHINPQTQRITRDSAPFGPHHPQTTLTQTPHSQLVLSASEGIVTSSSTAELPNYGTRNGMLLLKESTRRSSPRMGAAFVQSGSEKKGVPSVMTRNIFAPAVEPRLTELRDALMHRRSNPTTPYKAAAWEHELRRLNILGRFRDIPDGLRYGFIINFPRITCTQSPPNRDSVETSALSHLKQ